MLATTFMEYAVWAVAAAICLSGALGVVLFRNPVHNALSLIATLFGVAVLFVAQEAYFLAVIQVIVYAGAIVVLFLFVIMLLGVDRQEVIRPERRVWRRPAAIVAGAAIPILVLIAALIGTSEVTGLPSGTLSAEGTDVANLGRTLFTDYVYAFEITAVLLTVAVVGAVVLSRRPEGDPIDLDELPIEPGDEDDDLEDDLVDEDGDDSDTGEEAGADAEAEDDSEVVA
jgi:NADH-quinone oxidoreductase subunit J